MLLFKLPLFLKRVIKRRVLHRFSTPGLDHVLERAFTLGSFRRSLWRPFSDKPDWLSYEKRLDQTAFWYFGLQPSIFLGKPNLSGGSITSENCASTYAQVGAKQKCRR